MSEKACPNHTFYDPDCEICDVFANITQLQERIKELEDGIRDDLKLYKLVGIDVHPGLEMPEEEFLQNCRHYWWCQQKGVEYVAPFPELTQEPTWAEAKEIVDGYIQNLIPDGKVYYPCDSVQVIRRPDECSKKCLGRVCEHFREVGYIRRERTFMAAGPAAYGLTADEACELLNRPNWEGNEDE